MAIPPESLDLIKSFEGYLKPLNDGTGRVKPYYCPAHVATIGYGSTFYEDRRKVRISDPPITHERAKELLAFELGRICEPAVDRLTTVHLHPLSRGALVSFAFNCGTGALKSSTLLKRINRQHWDDVPRQFAKWRMGGGRVLRGLERRRKAEADMFMLGLHLMHNQLPVTPPLPERKPPQQPHSAPTAPVSAQPGVSQPKAPEAAPTSILGRLWAWIRGGR